MKRKALSLLLTFAMLLSLVVVPAAAAAPQGNWYDEAMSVWAERGVIQGDEQGDLHPTGNLTRAELAVMLDRIMGYQVKADGATFTDVQPGDWFADAVLKAAAAGILKGDGSAARPGATVTRQEATVMLARVLGLSGETGAAVSFTDEASIAAWAVDSVHAMAARGYIQGSNGLFRPADPITRAEVLTILNNVFAGYYDEAGTYAESVTGSAVIGAGGVTLSNLSISGDLLVAEGVGDGTVTLDGVTLGGRLIVRGGGEHSIVIKGNSKIDSVIVARQDGKVRVSVEGGADVSVVYVDDGSDAVRIEGSVGTVSVTGANASVEVAGAVDKVEVAETAEGASLTVTEGAKVDTVTNAAPGAEVTVSGEVKTVETAVTAEGSALTVAKDAKVDSVTNAAPESDVTVAGSVKTIETAESAAKSSVTVQKGGEVTTIANAAPKADVAVAGTVKTIETAKTATDTTVTTEKGAKVTEVVANGEGTTVTGEAKVDKVVANADNTAVDTPNTKVEAGKDASGVTVGDKEVKPGSSTTTNSSGSGSSSGGGGGGGSSSGGGGSSGGGDTPTPPKPTTITVSSTADLKKYMADSQYTTITLGADIVLEETLVVNRAVTLNLSDKTLSLETRGDTNRNANPADEGDSISTILVSETGNLTLIGTGKVTTAMAENASGLSYSTKPVITCRGTFTMNSGTIDAAENVYYALGAFGPSCNITINGGTVKCQWGTEGVAIGSNGTEEKDGVVYYGYTIAIKGGNIIGGEQAMYLAGSGTTTISNGTLTGGVRGIEIRSGELTMSGGTVNAASTANNMADNNLKFNSGSTGKYTGTLVAGVHAGATNSAYRAPVTVNITGGTLANTSDNGAALVVVNEKATMTETDKVTVSVNSVAHITGQVQTKGTVGLTLDGAEWVFSSESFETAMSNSKNITLGSDVQTSKTFFVDAGKSVVLNLNGHKITTSMTPTDNVKEPQAYMFVNNGTFTVIGTDENSEITTGYTENPDNEQIRLFRNQSGALNIQGGTYTGYYTVDNNTKESTKVGTCTVSDGAVLNGGFACVTNWKNGNIVIDSATLNADYYALCNNGTYGGTSFEATNAKITSKEDTAIFFPAGDVLTLTDCTVTANSGSGIEAFAGTVTLKGNTKISAGETYKDSITKTGQGSFEDGSAILIGYRYGYKTANTLTLSVDETVELNSTNGNCIRIISRFNKSNQYDADQGVSSIVVSYSEGSLKSHGSNLNAFRNDVASPYGGTVTVNSIQVFPKVEPAAVNFMMDDAATSDITSDVAPDLEDGNTENANDTISKDGESDVAPGGESQIAPDIFETETPGQTDPEPPKTETPDEIAPAEGGETENVDDVTPDAE